jgi:hypothetical protein
MRALVYPATGYLAENIAKYLKVIRCWSMCIQAAEEPDNVQAVTSAVAVAVLHHCCCRVLGTKS